MSKGREISDYLDDIVAAIADAEEFTRGMSYEMFAADKKTVNAVIRCLEILGQAAKHIPTSFRKKHPAIPWSKGTSNGSSLDAQLSYSGRQRSINTPPPTSGPSEAMPCQIIG
ncbi:MAG: hypothetical protein C0407_05780 [Desulfobacca sp.]|nr:hypothetical protein [Desulfobacca sp.]